MSADENWEPQMNHSDPQLLSSSPRSDGLPAQGDDIIKYDRVTTAPTGAPRVFRTPKVMQAENDEYNRAVQSPTLQNIRNNQENGVGVNARWSAALSGLRREQEERILNEKTKIDASNQQIRAHGVATKRIEQWKELQVQQEPSAEEVAAMWKLVKDFLGDEAVLHEVDRHYSREAERFILGDTHLYSAAYIGLDLNLFLHASCGLREKYLLLCCGVESSRPLRQQIRATALAARGVNDQFYIAITLLAPQDSKRIAAGSTRICVFSPSDKNKRLADKEFNLVHDRDADIDDLLSESDDDYDDGTGAESDEGSDRDLKSEWTAALLQEAQGGADSMLLQAMDDDDQSIGSQALAYNSPVMSDKACRQTFPSAERRSHPVGDIDLLSVSDVNEPVQMWASPASGITLRELCSPTSGVIPLDVFASKEVGSCDKLFVAMSPNAAVVVSGSMNYTTSVQKCIVSDNCVYEWIRGASMSGWLYKWSAKYNGFGNPHRRYFVLRDNTLRYYKSRPISDAEFSLGKTFAIMEDSQLEVVTNMFQRCLKLFTPYSSETLLIRWKDGSRYEDLWIEAIKRSIELQQSKRRSLTNTIRTFWFPEVHRCSYDIVAADAASVGEASIKVALFRLERDGYVSAAAADEEEEAPILDQWALSGTLYTVDVSANGAEKNQMELVLTNETPFSESNLRCVKLYGDKVLVGGSGGYLGVGMIGMTTDLSLGQPRRVVYVVACRVSKNPSNPSSSDSTDSFGGSTAAHPHALSAEIRFFAWSEQTDIFVAADNQRTLSFWHLRKDQTAEQLVASPVSKKRPGFYYDCKPELQSSFNLAQVDPEQTYADEIITAIQFLNEQSYLLVSTNMRLVLLDAAYISLSTGQRRMGNVDHHHENRFGVVGFTELDTVENKSQRGLFALNVVTPPQDSTIGNEKRLSHRSVDSYGRRIVHWRAVADHSSFDPSAPACRVEREEWSIDRFNKALRSIKPL